MTKAIEKRLETARKARKDRLADREVPTVADLMLNALDALPGPSEQLEQIKAWASNNKTSGNLCAQLRHGVAQWWVAGPKK